MQRLNWLKSSAGAIIKWVELDSRNRLKNGGSGPDRQKFSASVPEPP